MGQHEATYLAAKTAANTDSYVRDDNGPGQGTTTAADSMTKQTSLTKPNSEIAHAESTQATPSALRQQAIDSAYRPTTRAEDIADAKAFDAKSFEAQS